MPITCLICNTEFPKIIPYQHLAKHDISAADYRKQYGDTQSDETKEKFKQQKSTKGIKKPTDPESVERRRIVYEKREAKYESGELIRKGTPKTPEQKAVLSQKQIEYAAANPEKMRDRALRAMQTKRENGYDLGASGRGRVTSEETKAKLRITGTLGNQPKADAANARILARIQSINLTLLNNVVEKDFKLKCNICSSEFTFGKQYFHESRFKKTLCPTCFPRNTIKSKAEIAILDYISSLGLSTLHNYRQFYSDLEIDIFVPELQIGFEHNGIYWHSEGLQRGLDRVPAYDYEKYKLFISRGLRVIQIFEDEWSHKQNIVKARIAYLLGKIPHVIDVADCHVAAVSTELSTAFCNANHLSGSETSDIQLGLFCDNELLSLMTFSKTDEINTWVISRIAHKLGYAVNEGSARLFNEFVTNYQPDQVIGYTDNRWSTGSLFTNLNFAKVEVSGPTHWYVNVNSLIRKPGHTIITDEIVFTPTEEQKLLPADELAALRSMHELQEYIKVTQLKVVRIWDCGTTKWIWSKE